MLLLALAIAPGLAIVLFIIYRDKFDSEPAGSLLMSFFLGMLSTIPAIALEMAADQFKSPGITGTIFSTFFFVALIEEMCKFVPLRYYSFTRKSFNEPLDGIVHGVMIAMGFATVENIGYAYEYGLNTALARMVSAVPGHASWGVMMGFFAGLAKFNHSKRYLLFANGLFLAILFHGAYDSCLFLTQLVPEEISVLLILGALASHILALILAAKLIKQHHRTSMNLYKNAPVLTIRHASSRDAAMINTLAYQIWPHAYGKILSPEQLKYMLQLIYSEGALKKQMAAGHLFIIAYNAGVPVGFASYSELETGVYKLHKLYILQNQHRRGIGRFLLDQIIADIKPKGATVIQLNVNRNNVAKGFYEKLNFEVVNSEDIDIGAGYFMNDYVMEKKI